MMIRVIYREHLSGALQCSLCGQPYELVPNVRVLDGGRTSPDARDVVYKHFHGGDKYLPACTARLEPGTTPWQAVNEKDGAILAHGRVEVEMFGNVIQSPTVHQDHPSL